jgi:hypothetical protein
MEFLFISLLKFKKDENPYHAYKTAGSSSKAQNGLCRNAKSFFRSPRSPFHHFMNMKACILPVPQ